jgi:hypothetical protein
MHTSFPFDYCSLPFILQTPEFQDIAQHSNYSE